MPPEIQRVNYRSLAALLVSFVLCFAAAGVGSLWTTPQIPGWYQQIQKPDWTPPAWVFGPVWTFLYASMAVAAWLVWRQRSVRAVALPLGLFALQLALNVAWSGLFFALQNPLAGLVDIVLLWLAILATTWSFLRCSRPAGWLLVPYLLWVSYASALNLAIWRLNA